MQQNNIQKYIPTKSSTKGWIQNEFPSENWLYIYIIELPIYKKESGCIPPRFGDTLSKSRFDFENQTQSEARELPTSGHNSVMEGPRILLIVFIGLYYTYT